MSDEKAAEERYKQELREMLIRLLDWANNYKIELYTVIVDEFLAEEAKRDEQR